MGVKYSVEVEVAEVKLSWVDRLESTILGGVLFLRECGVESRLSLLGRGDSWRFVLVWSQMGFLGGEGQFGESKRGV